MQSKFFNVRRLLTAAILAALPAIFGQPAVAADGGLTTFKFALSSKNISPTATPFAIPEYLGYFKEEGLKVEVLALGSNAATAAAAEAGRVDAVVGVPSFQLPQLAKNEKFNFIDYFEFTYPFKWGIAVKPDSSVKTIDDLKGKKIGVSNLGTTDYPMGKALLRKRGIDPEKDVTWLAVGRGATAGHALTKGNIDVLIYYDTGFGSIEAAGIPLRYVPLPTDTPKVGGLYISVTKDQMVKNRKQLIGFARGVAKAMLFIRENPEAAAYAFLQMFPEAAPRAKSLKQQIKAVALPLRKRSPIFFNYDKSNKKIGFINAAELVDDLEFLGLSKSLAGAKALYTNDLINEINNFDAEKIKQQARNFKIP